MNFESIDFTQFAANIKVWAQELGFQEVGITDTNVTLAFKRLEEWIKKGWHADMHYMHRHGTKRGNPQELIPGTLRIILVRMDYLPNNTHCKESLKNRNQAFIARYALGKDYHRLIRKRLTNLGQKIQSYAKNTEFRAFVDSGPVLEKPLAEKAGLGWMGKNTLILNRKAGSYFFLGSLFTNLPLPIDQPISAHCGSCTACIDVCPTKAIVAPYPLDARRCISYLTIENKGPIPIEFRKAMGNRIFGCDDCQIFCPWNRYAKVTTEPQFQTRLNLGRRLLIDLFSWSEEVFLKNTEGSALRRATYVGWLRNIAVALGNAPSSQEIIEALESKRNFPSDLVKEHVEWALQQHQA